MTRPSHTPPPLSARQRRALEKLRDRQLNFDLEAAEQFTSENGWHIDDYCQPLPTEPPGLPTPGGAWETAVGVMQDYRFADPSIVRAFYDSGQPLEDRNMLLEARFYVLKFHLGLRVGGVVDGTRTVDDRLVRVFGWNYRTLQGHLEAGQMDYEVWKWMDTGEVQFRIHAFSRAANIPNPIIRFGFAVFGRGMQKKFARRALERMRLLVVAEMTPPPTTA